MRAALCRTNSYAGLQPRSRHAGEWALVSVDSNRKGWVNTMHLHTTDPGPRVLGSSAAPAAPPPAALPASPTRGCPGAPSRSFRIYTFGVAVFESDLMSYVHNHWDAKDWYGNVQVAGMHL